LAVALVSAFVAVSLGLSAAFKFQDLEDFRRAIESYSLLARLPAASTVFLSVLIPVVEAAVALTLMLPGLNRASATAALMLGVGFVVVIGSDSRRAIGHCGCWGVASMEAPKLLYLLRSTVLLGFAAAALGLAFESPAAGFGTDVVALGLAAPLALLLLELPTIGQIVVLQRLSRGEA